ncbi:MAG TPA: hypothetical protein VHV74_15915 [Pseudonocardiaceae bacterium]|nr:hypothetical protein [Pseudonocardiaceae bacterium]
MAAEWPFDSDEVLAALPRWGWTMSAYGQRHHPDLLVAHYRMDDYVDVFVSRGHDRCGAYRARLWPGQDPVDAYGVTWCVTGDLSTVLAGVLNLRPVERGWPDYDPPAELRALLPNPPSATTPSARPNSCQ